MVVRVVALLALWLQSAAAEESSPKGPSGGAPACRRWIEETQHFDAPLWVDHVVRPRERPGQIAARYGVRLADLVAWNGLGGPSARLRPGKKVRVLTSRVPPPREEVHYRVRAGDGWSSVAIQHRVDLTDLEGWNEAHAGRPLEAGMHLSIWVDPGAPQTVGCGKGEAPPALVYRRDAESLGQPQAGRLRRGIPLPDSPLWTRGRKDRLWASTHTVDTMVEAFTRLRVELGYTGDVLIGSISRRKGGKFRPHRSHRTGLDIDIRLPLLPTVAPETYPSPDTVDWPALWALIESFIDTGEVSMIFLDRRLQPHLYRAARWAGRTPEELASIIHWPKQGKKWEAIVRHSRGHKGHIHVRLLCGPDEALCGPNRAEALERRGWIEPEPSGRASREGAKARREAWRAEGRLVGEEGEGEEGGDEGDEGGDEGEEGEVAAGAEVEAL